MSLDRYEKHLRSKYKKYLASDENGKILFETNSKTEFAVLNKEYHKKQLKSVGVTREDVTKPKFDPDTGERIT